MSSIILEELISALPPAPDGWRWVAQEKADYTTPGGQQLALGLCKTTLVDGPTILAWRAAPKTAAIELIRRAQVAAEALMGSIQSIQSNE